MSAERLLQHFDRISAAPDAVARRRRFILDLAVRGKLVAQDAEDEPAAALLKRIAAEKERLAPKRQEAKKGEKPGKEKLAACAPSGEVPFVLPESWCWVRFGDVFSLEYGDSLRADKRSNTGEYPVYGSNGIVGSHFECFVNSKCIVVGRKGSAGALNLSLTCGCCVTDVAYYCVPPSSFNMAFSFMLFQTLGLDVLGKGVKPGLNRNEAYALSVPIPPLAEQRRIVAKVDQLMTLCDQLESEISTIQTANRCLRDALAAAS
jgi:type I restriction enzyme, S subunit